MSGRDAGLLGTAQVEQDFGGVAALVIPNPHLVGSGKHLGDVESGRGGSFLCGREGPAEEIDGEGRV